MSHLKQAGIGSASSPSQHNSRYGWMGGWILHAKMFTQVGVCVRVWVGYGQSGPRSKTPGYDSIASAMSGMMHITGPEVSLCSVLSELFWSSLPWHYPA